MRDIGYEIIRTTKFEAQISDLIMKMYSDPFQK